MATMLEWLLYQDNYQGVTSVWILNCCILAWFYQFQNISLISRDFWFHETNFNWFHQQKVTVFTNLNIMHLTKTAITYLHCLLCICYTDMICTLLYSHFAYTQLSVVLNIRIIHPQRVTEYFIVPLTQLEMEFTRFY